MELNSVKTNSKHRTFYMEHICIDEHKFNCFIECLKFYRNNFTSSRSYYDSNNFPQIMYFIKNEIAKYMRECILKRKFINSNIKLQIIKLDRQVQAVETPHGLDMSDIHNELEIFNSADFNFDIDGDEIQTLDSESGKSVHIYHVVKDGRLIPEGNFSKLLKLNNKNKLIQQIRFIFMRILIIDMHWSWPHTKLNYRKARRVYKEAFGRKLFMPFTVSGIERRLYLTLYAQILPVLYSDLYEKDINLPYREIPLYS